MTRDDQDVPRKRLRVGHVSERGGVNAVRTLLEAHGHVVDEVDGRNDYGRDLIADITDRSEITGAVIGLQIKGDRRYIADDVWKLPVSAKDRRYWAESSIPIVGILWNPDNGEMRWTNLTEHARYESTAITWQPTWLYCNYDEPYNPGFAFFPEHQALNGSTLPRMIGLMRGFIRQTSSLSFLNLFDSDAERCFSGVVACWAAGHTDHRAILLLRHALLSLSGEALREAIVVLGMATDGANHYWAEEIKSQIRPALRWSAHEIYHLASSTSKFCSALGLLVQDPNFPANIPTAIDLAIAKGDLNGAFRIWILYRHLPADQVEAADIALARYPELSCHPGVQRELHEPDEFDDPWRGLVSFKAEPCCEECGSVIRPLF